MVVFNKVNIRSRIAIEEGIIAGAKYIHMNIGFDSKLFQMDVGRR